MFIYNGFVNKPGLAGCTEVVADEVDDAADGLRTVVTVGNGPA